MSYTKLSETIFYGIHPSIVAPDFKPDNYVMLCSEVSRMTREQVKELDEELLSDEEYSFRLLESSVPSHVYYYDIQDRRAPDPHTLRDLVHEISKLEGTVYIACRGGHGRSGVVAAALYRLRTQVPCKELLEYTNMCWKRDRDMSYLRPIIRKLGSPQTSKQKAVLQQYCDLLMLEA